MILLKNRTKSHEHTLNTAHLPTTSTSYAITNVRNSFGSDSATYSGFPLHGVLRWNKGLAPGPVSPQTPGAKRDGRVPVPISAKLKEVWLGQTEVTKEERRD